MEEHTGEKQSPKVLGWGGGVCASCEPPKVSTEIMPFEDFLWDQEVGRASQADRVSVLQHEL